MSKLIKAIVESLDIRSTRYDDKNSHIVWLKWRAAQYEQAYTDYMSIDHKPALDAYDENTDGFGRAVDDYLDKHVTLKFDKTVDDLWNTFKESIKDIYEKDKEQYLKLINEIAYEEVMLDEIYKLIDLLPKGKVTRSTKSVSTYITLDISQYDEVLQILKSYTYTIVTDRTDLKQLFVIRISDHLPGMYWNRHTGRGEPYKDGDISVLVTGESE